MSTLRVRNHIFHSFRDRIAELGYNPDELIRLSGIDPVLVDGKDTVVSHSHVTKLMRAAREFTQCKHLGLLIAGDATIGTLGASGLCLDTAPTLGAALKLMTEHLRVHVEGVHRKLNIEGEVAYITNRFEHSPFTETIEAIQISIAITWRLCRIITDYRWRPKLVCFTYAEPEDPSFYKMFFQCPVSFNADFNGIVFRSQDLALPLPHRDDALHRILIEHISLLEHEVPENFVMSVRNIISKHLDEGHCTLNAVLEYFPYEKRAFQRRLDAHGTSYRTLLNEVRFEKATHYLRHSNVPVSKLADMLCYESVSVFSRAFKERYGVSPSVWRRSKLER